MYGFFPHMTLCDCLPCLSQVCPLAVLMVIVYLCAKGARMRVYFADWSIICLHLFPFPLSAYTLRHRKIDCAATCASQIVSQEYLVEAGDSRLKRGEECVCQPTTNPRSPGVILTLHHPYLFFRLLLIMSFSTLFLTTYYTIFLSTFLLSASS